MLIAEHMVSDANQAIDHAMKHRDEPDAMIFAMVALSKSLLAIAGAIYDRDGAAEERRLEAARR